MSVKYMDTLIRPFRVWFSASLLKITIDDLSQTLSLWSTFIEHSISLQDLFDVVKSFDEKLMRFSVFITGGEVIVKGPEWEKDKQIRLYEKARIH